MFFLCCQNLSLPFGLCYLFQQPGANVHRRGGKRAKKIIRSHCSVSLCCMRLRGEVNEETLSVEFASIH
jgi:hypothetical protein